MVQMAVEEMGPTITASYLKGNIWVVHLDLNYSAEMSKHIPTHKRNHIEPILPGSGSRPAILSEWEKKQL